MTEFVMRLSDTVTEKIQTFSGTHIWRACCGPIFCKAMTNVDDGSLSDTIIGRPISNAIQEPHVFNN